MGPRDDADKGLEGVVACSTEISSIENDELRYRGYLIDELAAGGCTFEETAHLLWFGELPSRAQLAGLREKLGETEALPHEIVELMESLPASANPMSVLRSAVSALGIYDRDSDDSSPEANVRKAIHLTAELGLVVAGWDHVRHGRQPIPAVPGRSLAWNFLRCLTGREASEHAVRAFDTALVLHADHELNASTFAARVTAATMSDMHSAISAAIATLKGPLHGGANEQVMAMLEKIGSLAAADGWVREALANKERIMGFGHRVYRGSDPRAHHLARLSKEMGDETGDRRWYDISAQVHATVQATKGLPPNVDFYSASLYHALGIPHDLFTPIFAVSRVAGWTAHVLEQQANNRLIRPRALYRGAGPRPYIPLERR